MSGLMQSSMPVKPIFIMGAPGSGTTLLYEALCTHRDLAYVTHNILRTGVHKQGNFAGDKRTALLKMHNLMHRDKASNDPHEANAFWVKYLGTYDYLAEDDLTPEMAGYYRRNVLTVQNFWNRPRFINKNPQHCVRVKALDKIFPDAMFIHIIRDGRAVAYSMFNKIERRIQNAQQGTFMISLKKILGEQYRHDRSELFNYGLAWSELVKKAREASAFGKARYCELYYEDLIADPHAQIKSVVDFCGLEWYDKFEKNMPKTSNMNVKWKQNASEEQMRDLDESTLELRQALRIT